ncbi:hypothetical protein BJX61DRAFT_165458 [Aspergillus egyptiacus]|nr:hypothetical protein BJX61DRAFT_165458 [Aspergillus egyptiacus]
MKYTALLSILPLTNAWTFTWVNSEGEESIERGTGPSECIPVNHEKGQIFKLDGEGEPNINMLMFTNDECTGDPAGKATVNYTKEASVDILGFQVVALDGGDSTTTTTETEEGTVTLPTVTGTGTTTATATQTETETETETEGEVTLPTVTETTTEAETTATETETEATTTATTTTEPTPTEGEEAGEEPTPTDAASQLVLSKAGLAGVAVGVVAGGWAMEYLF